uniref:Uncharacterized protein n=1 Tax=Vespula pensylvanica TaxID=30213 RepID=A0A834NRL0_VESPE|nr:hypothetical protein H0235_011191 [Vespula pensylvanica]
MRNERFFDRTKIVIRKESNLVRNIEIKNSRRTIVSSSYVGSSDGGGGGDGGGGDGGSGCGGRNKTAKRHMFAPVNHNEISITLTPYADH